MFHPEGWAAGELDFVLRWDGNVRLIDIKSGHSGSSFSESLQHQLRFYACLWERTNEEGVVQSIEVLYLSSNDRIEYNAPSSEELTSMDEEFFHINETMRSMGEGASKLPANPSTGTADHIHACDGESAGCGWCGVSSENLGTAGPMNEKTRTAMIQGIKIRAPCAPFSEILSLIHI